MRRPASSCSGNSTGRSPAREAEIAAGEDQTIGALLGGWALALGRGWTAAVRNTPQAPVRGGHDVRHVRFAARRCESLAARRHPRALSPRGCRGGVRRTKAHASQPKAASTRCLPRACGRGSGSSRDVSSSRGSGCSPSWSPRFSSMRSSTAPSPRTARWSGTWSARRDGPGSRSWAARFVLSPTRPSLRLCTADDRTAWFLTRRIGIIFGWSAFANQSVPAGMGAWLAVRSRQPRVLDIGRLPRPHGGHHLAGPGRDQHHGARPRRRRPRVEPLRDVLADDCDCARRAPVAGRRALRRDRQPSRNFRSRRSTSRSRRCSRCPCSS